MDERKIHISIVGSCVPRDAFGIADETGKFVVDRFVQSINPISAMSESPLIKDWNLRGGDEERFGFKSHFHMRNAFLDLNKKLFSYLGEVQSDWLLMDLSCLRNNLFRFPDGSFCTAPLISMCKCSTLFDEHYLDESHETFSSLTIDLKILYKSLDAYITKMLELYPQERIIFFESYATYWYLKRSRKSCYVYNIPLANKFNKIFRIGFEYALRRMPHVHMIRFPYAILADETHKWGRHPLHYVDEYYKYAYEAVKLVVRSDGREQEMFGLMRLQRDCEDALRKYAPYKEQFLTEWDAGQREKVWITDTKDWLKDFVAKNKKQNLKRFFQSNKLTTVSLYGLSDVAKALIPVILSFGVKIEYIVEDGTDDNEYEGIIQVPRASKHYPETECMIITDLRIEKVRRKLKRMNVLFEVQDIYSIVS